MRNLHSNDPTHTPSSISEVLADRPSDGVLHLTLNRPQALNALNTTTTRQLASALDLVDAGSEVRAVVLAGAGPKAFSAGNDIWEMAELSEAENQAIQAEREALLWRWATLDVPTVVALNGLAAGYGTLLAVSADLRVGGPASTISVTASSYGAANLTFVLPQLIGWSHAKDILLTGRKVPPAEAHHMGLLNRLVEGDRVVPAAIELAEAIASKPPHGIRSVKALIHGGLGLSFSDLYEREVAATAAVKGSSVSELFGGFMGTRRRDDGPGA